MISLGPTTKVYIASEPVDMRNGMDGLAAICRQKLEADPMTGAVFVFTNRTHSHVRLLAYDGQGFWLCTKRLSAGSFRFWPEGARLSRLAAEQLYVLLRGGDPFSFRSLGDWHPVT